MHPLLVEVPWPALGIPLWPAFALLSAWGALIAGVAVRRGNRFATLLGAVLLAAAGVAAFTTRGSRLTTGPLEVHAWGALFAASLALGSLLAMRRGVRAGLERELTTRACVAAAIGGIVGARVVWALLHPAATESLAGSLAFYRGGLSVWGGLAGAVAGAWLSLRSHGASLLALCDVAAPSFAAGVVLTRLGCFLEGCDFGLPLGKGAPHALALLGTFPKNSPAWVEHVLARGLSPNAASALPVHPTAIYEAAGGAALVAVAWALGSKKLQPGFVFAAVIFAYLLLRVSLDSLRGDRVEMWVSRTLLLLSLLGAASFLGIRRFRSARK